MFGFAWKDGPCLTVYDIEDYFVRSKSSKNISKKSIKFSFVVSVFWVLRLKKLEVISVFEGFNFFLGL